MASEVLVCCCKCREPHLKALLIVDTALREAGVPAVQYPGVPRTR